MGRFKTSKEEVLVEFIGNIEQTSIDEIHSFLHNFKGMFGNIGASSLADSTAALQNQTTEYRSKDFETWAKQVHELLETISGIVEFEPPR